MYIHTHTHIYAHTLYTIYTGRLPLKMQYILYTERHTCIYIYTHITHIIYVYTINKHVCLCIP